MKISEAGADCLMFPVSKFNVSAILLQDVSCVLHLNQGWPTFFPQPPILFKSSSYPPHKRKSSKFHSEIKVFSKKKVNAGNQGAIRHRLATLDISRYKLWNIFHLKYFPQLQCAITKKARRKLATPDLNP